MGRILHRKDGRPSELESRRRTREFVRVLSECGSPVQAQQASRVAPSRALALLDDPAVLAVLVAARAEAA